MKHDKLKIEYIPLSDLKPFSRNAKKHDTQAIKKSMIKFGFCSPILIDSDTMTIVAGHGRLEALQELQKEKQSIKGIESTNGIWKVPVIKGQSFNPDEIIEYSIIDNQLTMLGGWNDKQLEELLKEYHNNYKDIFDDINKAFPESNINWDLYDKIGQKQESNIDYSQKAKALKDIEYIRFLDCFAGIGGFRLGIEKALTKEKCKCIGTIEIDKQCCSVYSKQFNERIEPTDITTIDAAGLPDFDLLCGGFPCQSFSICGQRQGFKDSTKGTLFFDLARIIEIKRPTYIFLENVKGLLNHDEGRTLTIIFQTLDELGYDYQWMVLDSQFFGVPQHRERIFIIGTLREKSRQKILSFPQRNIMHTERNGDRKIFSFRLKNFNTAVMNIINTLTKDESTMTTCIYIPDYNKNDDKNIEVMARCLLPIEEERLQGFPNNWTQYGIDNIEMSDNVRRGMCGNAVTVNVIEAIIRQWFIYN